MTTQTAAPQIERIPADLRSSQAKLVYHSLDVGGPGDVDELADRLGLKKITLLDVLASLQASGHVRRDGGEFAPS